MLRLMLSILTMTGLWAPGLQAQQGLSQNVPNLGQKRQASSPNSKDLSPNGQDLSQNRPVPKGYKKGTVVLEDNTVLSGNIREHIRSHSSILFIPCEGGKRKELDGGQLYSVKIDSTSYRCWRGDFFRVITDGEIVFLQKCSDASGKPVYNGTDPLLINGTEGRPGDYFVYNNDLRQLTRVTRKTLGKVVRETFGNCTAAIDKAGAVHSDIIDLRSAIELYNNRSK